MAIEYLRVKYDSRDSKANKSFFLRLIDIVSERMVKVIS